MLPTPNVTNPDAVNLTADQVAGNSKVPTLVRQIAALRPAALQEFTAAQAAGIDTFRCPLPLFNELGRLNRMLYTGQRPGTASGSATGG